MSHKFVLSLELNIYKLSVNNMDISFTASYFTRISKRNSSYFYLTVQYFSQIVR